MTAGFQNVIESNHIALDVSIRVGDGVANTSLNTKVDHNVWMMLLKNAVDKCLVRKVALDKWIVLELLKFCKTRLFDMDIIVIVHVIQANDLSVGFCSQSAFSKIRANKARRASYKIVFTSFSSILALDIMYALKHILNIFRCQYFINCSFNV